MSFQRHARTVALLTLVSRFAGIAREATLSRIFGAGALTDAFFFAFLVPNLFRRLFGEGALAAAFIPTYTDLDKNDPVLARRLASAVIARLLLGLGFIVLLAEVLLLVLGQIRGETSLTIWLTMLMLPYAPLVCGVALLGAMLQVHERFGPAAAAPIILNVCIIAAALFGGVIFDASDPERDRAMHIGVVAAAVIVAGLIQIGWTFIALRDRRWWTRERDGAGDALRRITRMAGPMILGLGVLQINTLLDGVIANYRALVGPTIFGVEYPLETGALSAVTFAQRLYQFPLGVFGIAVATAIYPALARLAKDEAKFARTVRRGLRLVVYIGLPASLGLVLVRHPLVATVLEGGLFRSDDTHRVSRVLLGYAPAIWAYSMTHVVTRAFYAREEPKTPVRIAMGVVGLNLVLNCTLIWTPLREAGLAWSTSFCAAVQTVALLVMLRRRLSAPLLTAGVVQSWLRCGAGTVVMGLCTIVIGGFVTLADGAPWRDALVALLVPVVAGIFVYVLTTVRMAELRWALGRDD